MATYRKRNSKWHVQVRRMSHQPQTKSFSTKEDARKWAMHVETTLDKDCLPVELRCAQDCTVGDLIERYRDTITIQKRCAASEAIRLGAMLRQPWCKTPLRSTGAHVFSMALPPSNWQGE